MEGNVRRDQSSRLPKNNRVGIFPSTSAAWRVSEESFIKDNFPTISNLKLRGSWGTLGNQEIDDYAYVQLINTGQNYVLAMALREVWLSLTLATPISSGKPQL